MTDSEPVEMTDLEPVDMSRNLAHKMGQSEDEVSELAEVERVIRIDPKGRYVFMLPDDATDSEANELATFIADWWESDRAFCVVRRLKLVRVDADGEKETEETQA